MTEWRYQEMDRAGKANKSYFKYRKTTEHRLLYLIGYIKGQLLFTPTPVIDKLEYIKHFGVSKGTFYSDIKEIKAYHPEIIIK